MTIKSDIEIAQEAKPFPSRILRTPAGWMGRI